MTETPEPPKLYVNKPKKLGEAAAAGSAYPEPKSPGLSRFWYRFRSAFGVLLVANFVIGGYVLLTKSTSSKDENAEDEGEKAAIPNKTDVLAVSGSTNLKEQEMKKETGPADVVAISSSVTAPVVTEVSHLKESQPQTSEDQQREILRWVLAEKRKIKPANPAEKKKIDEEKKLLKEFLRAKSLPSI
ncbi:hypothetical protein O6H91_11G041800 [Diphasiastrum complanatum]|uniref:Uncharacterized protein n=1 Tax=Diphasiastrum complanatum TaxID=34168 RepID=A0ACC2C8T8_DIPCM|nr:hypothetical protein O6H91_11G041800 [Diphasiastrum complanatum]